MHGEKAVDQALDRFGKCAVPMPQAVQRAFRAGDRSEIENRRHRVQGRLLQGAALVRPRAAVDRHDFPPHVADHVEGRCAGLVAVGEVGRAARQEQLAEERRAGAHAAQSRRQRHRWIIEAEHVLAQSGADQVVEPHGEPGIAVARQGRKRLREQPAHVFRSQRRRAVPERCVVGPVPRRVFSRVIEDEMHPVREAQVGDRLLEPRRGVENFLLRHRLTPRRGAALAINVYAVAAIVPAQLRPRHAARTCCESRRLDIIRAMRGGSCTDGARPGAASRGSVVRSC